MELVTEIILVIVIVIVNYPTLVLTTVLRDSHRGIVPVTVVYSYIHLMQSEFFSAV